MDDDGAALPSYMVAAGCDIIGANANRAAAAADIANFMTPAPAREIEGWLAELSVLTAGRQREGMNAALTLAAYASRLGAYPADVARHALLGTTWKWWPTWAELERVCEAKTGPRRHMLAALAQPEPDPEPQRRRPTPEDRERVARLVAQMFPGVSAEAQAAGVDHALRGECFAAVPDEIQHGVAPE